MKVDAAPIRRMGGWIREFEARTRANPDIRPGTVRARLGAVKRLLKTWPGIERLPAEGITPAAVLDWACRFKRDGTQFRPPGARAARRGNSATSVNSAVDALRGILQLAVDSGRMEKNPALQGRNRAAGRLKKKVGRKMFIPPSREELERLFLAMENNGSVGGRGREAADFCRCLAMSGARVGELRLLTWSLVYWERRLIHLPGYKTESSARLIPLFPELAALFCRVRERRRSAARFRRDGRSLLEPGDAIFRIGECQRTIDGACRRLGMARITHHDFRHLFATMCIESGVDVPTVSRWLGHADGGVLAMRTYGHLRAGHSWEAAQRVSFGVANTA